LQFNWAHIVKLLWRWHPYCDVTCAVSAVFCLFFHHLPSVTVKTP